MVKETDFCSLRNCILVLIFAQRAHNSECRYVTVGMELTVERGRNQSNNNENTFDVLLSSAHLESLEVHGTTFS